MAAPACRLLATCRLFERLSLAAPASFNAPSIHTSQWQQGSNSNRCINKARMTSLLSPCQAACQRSAVRRCVPHRHTAWYPDKRISGNLGVVGVGKVDPDFTPITDQTEGGALAEMVNVSLERGEEGRLFAVVAINKTQRKVTVEDIIVLEDEFHPTVGDRLRLEKVMMVGGKDFTLLGQPLLSRDQVRVEATVIEKTLSHNKVWSTYKRRKRYRKMKLFRTPHTVLVINSIQVTPLPQA